MQKLRVDLLDDLEAKRGNPEVMAKETVRFALDGSAYEIDLSEQNAGGLRDALAEYISAARKTASPPRARRDRSHAADHAKVRDWARENGFEIKDRGRVPAPIMDKYRAAHG